MTSQQILMVTTATIKPHVWIYFNRVSTHINAFVRRIMTDQLLQEIKEYLLTRVRFAVIIPYTFMTRYPMHVPHSIYALLHITIAMQMQTVLISNRPDELAHVNRDILVMVLIFVKTLMIVWHHCRQQVLQCGPNVVRLRIVLIN